VFLIHSAADPQATPQRITSFRLCFEIKPKPCRPPITGTNSFFFSNIGREQTHTNLWLPEQHAVKGNTTISAPPLAMICFAAFTSSSSIAPLQLVLLVQHWFDHKHTHTSFNASPEVSTMSLELDFFAISAIYKISWQTFI
jgi:hypothetical protein